MRWQKSEIGAQLIIWGGRAVSDPAGVLGEVASLGYEGIESGMDPFKVVSDPEKLISSFGLSLAGLHMSITSTDAEAVDKALRLLNRVDSHNENCGSTQH